MSLSLRSPVSAVSAREAQLASSSVPGPLPTGRSEPVAGRGVFGNTDVAVLGILAPLAQDASVTDIHINGCDVWVDRGHGMEASTAILLQPHTARDLAIRLVALGGRHLDEAAPLVDARLPGGIRVHAVLSPIATPAPLVSIRLPPATPMTLEEIVDGGACSQETRAQLEQLVAMRRNVLVSGAAGTGKTTLLGAMLSKAAASERIVLIEDVAELRVAHPHVVGLESRQANLEGAGSIELPRLVREALRMRPDRIVLGECRGAEVRELLMAMNTGHDGGMGTIHANSLTDLAPRLEALGALAGLDAHSLARQAVSAIDAVIHLERVSGRRVVSGIGELRTDDRDRLTVEQVA